MHHSRKDTKAPVQAQMPAAAGNSQSPPQFSLEAAPLQRQEKAIQRNSDPADIIMVAFTGGVDGNETSRAPTGEGSTTDQIAFNLLQQGGIQGKKTFSTVISPGQYAGPSVTEGYDYIKARYSPNAKILIYGYSRGGDCAADLCHRLNGDDIPVDLLVTVDAALGPFSSTRVTRAIPPNVRQNMNQYQTAASPLGSRGDSNQAADPANTLVENHNLTERVSSDVTHGNIDEYAMAVNTNLLQSAAGLEVDWTDHQYGAEVSDNQGSVRGTAGSSSRHGSDSTSSGSTSSGSGSTSFRDRNSSSSGSSN